tara:strand:+ start:32 stop:187 length:156 start_codon:yes stop_codon:yes gene_type:complete
MDEAVNKDEKQENRTMTPKPVYDKPKKVIFTFLENKIKKEIERNENIRYNN